MIDWIILLTPILILPVVALLGFVGCNWFFGLDPTVAVEPGPPPTGLVAVPGNAKVALTWEPYPTAVTFEVTRRVESGPYTVSYGGIPGAENAYTDIGVINGTTYSYIVQAIENQGSTMQVSEPSVEVSATPSAASLLTFITAKTLGNIVASATGWFGMAIQIGPQNVLVQSLGRAFAPNNSQIHIVKIVDANGIDVPGAFVSIPMAGGTVGEFIYADLSPFVTLTANTTYYIVSQEIAGMDSFYNHNTMVQTTNAAMLTTAVRGMGTTYVMDSIPNTLYGPVNFRY